MPQIKALARTCQLHRITSILRVPSDTISSTISMPTSSGKTTSSPTPPITTHTSEINSVTSSASVAQTATSTAILGSTSAGSLSVGAEAGIGVGVSLVGLAAIIGCGALVWHLRRNSSKSRGFAYELNQNSQSKAPQSLTWRPTEAKWPARPSTNIPAELPEQSRAELG